LHTLPCLSALAILFAGAGASAEGPLEASSGGLGDSSGAAISPAGDYASIDASISPDGASRATLAAAPLPLARGSRSGSLLVRTGTAAPGSRGCRWPDEGALSAVLPIMTDHGSHASGVVFATDRVLTAAHALSDSSRVFVRIAEGFRSAKLLLRDESTDVAVLQVDTRGIAPLPIVRGEPTERQAVWAVGYPRAAGRTTTSGVFQRTRAGALHSSAPIDSGQSGGALLTCERGLFSVLGMLRGYGAYRSGGGYVKLDNHSVSVAGATIHRLLTASRQ